MQADDLSTTFYMLRWLRITLFPFYAFYLKYILVGWPTLALFSTIKPYGRRDESTKCYKDNQRSMGSNGSQYLRRDKGLTATHSISLPRAVFHCSLLFRFEFYCFSVSLTSVLTSVRELPPMIYAFDLYEIFMITRLVCELLKRFRAVLFFEY